jgi:hypothetical protein
LKLGKLEGLGAAGGPEGSDAMVEQRRGWKRGDGTQQTQCLLFGVVVEGQCRSQATPGGERAGNARNIPGHGVRPIVPLYLKVPVSRPIPRRLKSRCLLPTQLLTQVGFRAAESGLDQRGEMLCVKVFNVRMPAKEGEFAREGREGLSELDREVLR